MAVVLPTPPELLKLLAHDLRWQLLHLLAGSDYRVQELGERLHQPQNLISYHLRRLREQRLVTERRSSADGRDVYYSIHLEQLRALYLDAGQLLHPALAFEAHDGQLPLHPSGRPWRILFLCTHNSARSQLAEGIARREFGHAAEVFSAGSEPGRVHPLAIRAAERIGLDLSRQRSKHMDEFAGQHFDVVITVCDRVREVCPVFPDDPHQIHWSIADPAAVGGNETTRMAAFDATAREVTTRVAHLQQLIARRAPTE